MAGIKVDTKTLEDSIDELRREVSGFTKTAEDLNTNLVAVQELLVKIIKEN